MHVNRILRVMISFLVGSRKKMIIQGIETIIPEMRTAILEMMDLGRSVPLATDVVRQGTFSEIATHQDQLDHLQNQRLLQLLPHRLRKTDFS